MAVDITVALKEITAWPVADQIELLHQAWDHLIDSDAQKAEFDRRLDDLDATPRSAVSVEKLIVHVRRPR